MKVAILAPINLLEEYSALSTYHLTLAHLYDNEEYREFYRARYSQGDWIILDNGANEDVDITDKELAHIAKGAGVNEVVAPDHPRDGEESTERTLRFIATYGKELKEHNIRIMGCPQGISLRHWLHNFRLIAPHVDTIGISKKVDEFFDRVALTRLVANMYPNIHLLGADKIPGWIGAYQYMPSIRGVDTQKPFAAGLCGTELLFDTHKSSIPSINLGGKYRISTEQDRMIKDNITRYRGWAGDIG
ncbi:hypothetical protein LCGC14_1597200 [marine sediment metagenome]|uniref:Uncharacterized protein n=1 Tax=marine sediment metagenome TaxID=412755 RepID=A0A0F9LCI4_9ZZZZ